MREGARHLTLEQGAQAHPHGFMVIRNQHAQRAGRYVWPHAMNGLEMETQRRKIGAGCNRGLCRLSH
jgi:hypothetical protein